MWLCALFAVLLPACSQQQNPLPQTIPAVISQGRDGVCPSAEESAAIIEDIFEQVLAHLNIQPPCPCGGPEWTRIAHLNMSDPSEQCPSNWSLITTPVRGCGRSSTQLSTCDSAIFTSSGQSYSRVCGRVNAYQRGSPNAFDTIFEDLFTNITSLGLQDAYVDGVSLTYGDTGSRQHIWTFAAALYENDTSYVQFLECPCSNTNRSRTVEVPKFVGDDYFCDTGNRGPEYFSELDRVFIDDPLWDGEGCGPTSTCCEFNSPPWFCTTLPQPTTDDIEVRICLDQGSENEDVIVSLVDIYIM